MSLVPLNSPPILLQVDVTLPRLVLRIDLDPGNERLDGNPPILILSFVAHEFSEASITELKKMQGKTCEAESWPDGDAQAQLDLYLDYPADPLTLFGSGYKQARQFRSEADMASQVKYLRRVAEENRRDFLEILNSSKRLTHQLTEYLNEQIERTHRKQQFFLETNKRKSDEFASQKQIYEKIIELLQ